MKNLKILGLCCLCVLALPNQSMAQSANPMMPQPGAGMPANPNLASPNNIDDVGIMPPQGMVGGMPADSGVAGTPSPTAQALNIETIPPELRILKKVEEELKSKFKSNVYVPVNIPSLFFTPAQQTLLSSARQGFNNALPSDEDMAGLAASDPNATEAIIPSVTEISLGGILFNGDENWVIWLNGARTTKETLPKEIIDIQVGADYIQLKWFDEATNQIFPVRLRPNQKFDITKKVFLPAG
jgi:hypothetical protein